MSGWCALVGFAKSENAVVRRHLNGQEVQHMIAHGVRGFRTR